MIDQHRVRIEHRFRCDIPLDRRVPRVSVIEPQTRRRSRLEIRHAHPDKGLAHQRIIFLDPARQRGLVVVGHDSNIAPVLFRRSKIEIRQPNQNRRRPDRVRDRPAGRAGVDGHFLANGPLVVPPGVGRAGTRQGEANDQEGEKAFHKVVMFQVLEFRPEAKRQQRFVRVGCGAVVQRQCEIQ